MPGIRCSNTAVEQACTHAYINAIGAAGYPWASPTWWQLPLLLPLLLSVPLLLVLLLPLLPLLLV
jgi:hypothetical protein